MNLLQITKIIPLFTIKKILNNYSPLFNLNSQLNDISGNFLPSFFALLLDEKWS